MRERRHVEQCRAVPGKRQGCDTAGGPDDEVAKRYPARSDRRLQRRKHRRNRAAEIGAEYQHDNEACFNVAACRK
ncbi:hypothetical protein D3C78_1750050 [compost metagenome]